MIKTIGFLGCGNMGGAIARAVCKAADPQNVYLANRTASKAEKLAGELGCNTTTNAEVAARCDLIFLGVKPQMMESLLAPLKFSLNERPGRFILCSMAAGLSITRIQEMAGEDYPVIRIMPNTPAMVGAGMIQYCSSNVTAEEEAEFLKLMAPAVPERERSVLNRTGIFIRAAGRIFSRTGDEQGSAHCIFRAAVAKAMKRRDRCKIRYSIDIERLELSSFHIPFKVRNISIAMRDGR